MSLQSILELSSSHTNKKLDITESRVRECLPTLRNLIAFYREYPDIFVDQIKGEKSTFKFYFYQRVFLRIVMRHRIIYATQPRAYSKSFLCMLALVLKCILYPGAHLFVTTGGKEQAASITVSKIEEIFNLIPALKNEFKMGRGESSSKVKDMNYLAKNGSKIDILAANQRSRGQRRVGGVMEEVILIDGTTLNEVIIPTTNISRLLPNGERDNMEVINKSQSYITTAGWKNSFAYQKLIELLIQSIIDPDEVMIFGGTYETPVKEGLLDEDFVDQLKLQGTFNEASFDREYRSKWSGDIENSFFSNEIFDKHRQLLQPEYEFSGRSAKEAYYVIGVDVGRAGCTTEAAIIKVTPQPQGIPRKSLVNLFSYDAEHFENQAIHIKKLFYKYRAKVCAIDANGLGIGLIDYMVKRQTDPDTGDELPPFGVSNDEKGMYKQFITDDTVKNAMFLIKANAVINTEMHTYVQTQLSSGKIKFLIDERDAKNKLINTKVGQEMTPEQRAQQLMPFTLTTILKEEMLNLTEETDGMNIILKRSNKKIQKDKFSALEYGLYYVKQDESSKKRRSLKDFSKILLFN